MNPFSLPFTISSPLSRPIAAAKPQLWSVLFGGGWYQLPKPEYEDMYWTVARTSIGATLAAWR